MAVDWDAIETHDADRDRAWDRAVELAAAMPDVVDAQMIVDILDVEFVGSAFYPGVSASFRDDVVEIIRQTAADR